jgi:hypothetical protein
MKRITRASALLAGAALSSAAVVGCNGDAVSGVRPSGVRLAAVAANAGGPLARPISGSCETTTVAPPVFTPPILQQTDRGTCQLSHLGHATVLGTQQINVAAGTETAEVTFTAANGDALYTTNVGANTKTGPTTIRFAGTMTIVGGTGRFTGATGQIRAEGTADLVTGSGQFTLDGWIAFDASSRSGT